MERNKRASRPVSGEQDAMIEAGSAGEGIGGGGQPEDWARMGAEEGGTPSAGFSHG